jgi:hypothetical protein
MSSDTAYARTAGVIARRIAGETILVPVTQRAQEMGLFTLNEVATFVWERLDGCRVGSLIDAVVAQFEVDAPRAREDLARFLTLLVEAGCAREVAP